MSKTPLMTTPDDLRGAQAYCEELKRAVWDRDRRCAQLAVELQTERERWARLRANAIDADRMGHSIDVVSHMRAIEADVPSVPVLLVQE